jgi:uncharacterized BrkB/YihY/UPF0761 family membrane protein
MILSHPWWHLLVGGFLAGAGWDVGAWIVGAVIGMVKR